MLYNASMLKNKKSQIIFVYNADSGLANSLIDYGKKYISPSKYDCQLCMVSYGPFGIKKDWKTFVGSLPYTVSFLHKNEFKKNYPRIEVIVPAMLIVSGSRVDILLDAKSFEEIHNLEELKTKVNESITKYSNT
jgi:hypothetical protein